MSDTIESKENVRILVKEGERWIKHVHCNGARFHVLSWSTQGTHCSEEDCIYNKPKEKK